VETYRWVPFDPDGELPDERRCVLVQVAGEEPTGHAAAVAVGYLRIHSGGPFFVIPGIGRVFTVTHWCDCLGDDFTAPLWPGTPGMQTRERRYRAAAAPGEETISDA
jgi:hypothetical protein